MFNNIIITLSLLIIACVSAHTLTTVEMLVHNQVIAISVFVLSKLAIGYRMIKS